MSKAKYWKGMAAGVIILAVILVAAAGAYMFLKENVKEYEKTEEIFGNPLMGYAPGAWNLEISQDISLLIQRKFCTRFQESACSADCIKM